MRWLTETPAALVQILFGKVPIPQSIELITSTSLAELPRFKLNLHTVDELRGACKETFYLPDILSRGVEG